MNIEDVFEIGFIARTHGLKGGVVVNINQPFELPATHNMALFIQQGADIVPYFTKEISIKGDKAYITFEDITSIEQAQRLTKNKLYLPREARPKLRGVEFYDDEVTGFSISHNSNRLGIIAAVVWSGTQRLLEVKGADKDYLIPVNPAFIRKVDRKSRSITVELPEGFLDI